MMHPNYSLTHEQIERSLVPVRANRIEKIQGNDYIPQHEVRAELSRQFGPGNWDSQVVSMELVYETSIEKDGKTRFIVGYRAGVRLRIRDLNGNPVAEFVEYHFDEKQGPSRNDCHGNAITSAASYALRRAAIGLGDNYGLSLYTGSGPVRLIQGTLALPPQPKPEAPPALAPTPSDPELEKAAQIAAEGFGVPADGLPMSEASETMAGTE